MRGEAGIKTGVMMGAGAIGLWSTAASFTVWCVSRLGFWQFLAIACGIGGLAQAVCYAAQGRDLRRALLPPGRLWVVVLLGFVLYMLVYTRALVSSASRAQTIGVALINHLWAILTVVFAAIWVPGTAMTRRLGIALVLALGGVVLANWGDVWSLVRSGGVAEGGRRMSLVPYLLAGVAAVLWAGYSGMLARWRSWANRYATATVGFLIVGAVAAIVCACTGQWSAMGLDTWVAVVCSGLGPYGAGYMLWELALHRAPATVLGLMAAATPVLSTLCLLAMFAWAPGAPAPGESAYVTLVVAAVMVGSAVILSLLPGRKRDRRGTEVRGGDGNEGTETSRRDKS